MRQLWRNNGLSIVLVSCFLIFWLLQSLTGWRAHNLEKADKNEPQLTYTQYLGSSDFWEATGENWESEFFQMGFYVLLTIFLFQKGSSESKDPDEESAPQDEDPARHTGDPNAPAPVRAGGLRMRLYSCSLSLAFIALFILSFAIHFLASHAAFNEDQQQQGQEQVTCLQYLGTSKLWAESFQNWQSEFLAIASMVVLSIFFRQQGSPESKPVHAPHSETGS